LNSLFICAGTKSKIGAIFCLQTNISHLHRVSKRQNQGSNLSSD